MVLELQIVDGKRVLFRTPIEPPVEQRREVGFELDKGTLERLAAIHSIAANERRLRVMMELMRRGEMQFSDLLLVAENPKLVSDCVKPLIEEGMVVHEKWGSSYRPTWSGSALAATMTTGLAKLLEYLEEGQEEDELE
jgi:hypothetical protein